MIKLTRADVSMIPLAFGCQDCEENRATHSVQIMHRRAGLTIVHGKFCLECGEECVQRIREGLPEGAGE